jgi:hypothetical protein
MKKSYKTRKMNVLLMIIIVTVFLFSCSSEGDPEMGERFLAILHEEFPDRTFEIIRREPTGQWFSYSFSCLKTGAIFHELSANEGRESEVVGSFILSHPLHFSLNELDRVDLGHHFMNFSDYLI